MIALMLVALTVAGCAEKSADVSAAYVSPLQYQSYSCRQLQEEAARVSTRAAQLSGQQDKNAQDDAVATGVALILFWPAVFFINGNKDTKAELARLKGEVQAIEAISIQKKCPIKFQ